MGSFCSEKWINTGAYWKYFKDVYDHVIQAYDLSENYRDMMMNLQDLYLEYR